MRLSSQSSGSTFPLLRLRYKVATFEPELRQHVSFTTAGATCRARAPGARFLYYGCTTKLRLSSQSSGSTFPLLRLDYKVATFEPELRKHVSFATAVLQSCDFRAGAPGARFLYSGWTTKLRLSSQSSGSTFPLLRLYYKVATFEPELRQHVSFTTAVLQSCDFRAGAPGARFLYSGWTTKLRLLSRSPAARFLYYCWSDCRAGAPAARFLYSGCTTKLRRSSRSSGSTFPLLRLDYKVATFEPEPGSTFPLLRLYYKVATFEPELRQHVSFTTAVLQSCDFRAGAPGARFLYYAFYFLGGEDITDSACLRTPWLDC